MSFPSPPSVPPGGYGPPGHRYGGLPQTGYMGLPPDPQAQAVQTAAQGRLKRLRLILVACVAGVFPVGGALAVVTIASEPSIATIGLALEAGATMAALLALLVVNGRAIRSGTLMAAQAVTVAGTVCGGSGALMAIIGALLAPDTDTAWSPAVVIILAVALMVGIAVLVLLGVMTMRGIRWAVANLDISAAQRTADAGAIAAYQPDRAGRRAVLGIVIGVLWLAGAGLVTTALLTVLRREPAGTAAYVCAVIAIAGAAIGATASMCAGFVDPRRRGAATRMTVWTTCIIVSMGLSLTMSFAWDYIDPEAFATSALNIFGGTFFGLFATMLISGVQSVANAYRRSVDAGLASYVDEPSSASEYTPSS